MTTTDLLYWFVVTCAIALCFAFFMWALIIAVYSFYALGREMKNRRMIKRGRKANSINNTSETED